MKMDIQTLKQLSKEELISTLIDIVDDHDFDLSSEFASMQINEFASQLRENFRKELVLIHKWNEDEDWRYDGVDEKVILLEQVLQELQ